MCARSQDTVLELNYSDYHLIDTGYPGWFTYGEKITLPPAPDPSNVGYGQKYRGRRSVDAHGQCAPAQARFQFQLAFGGGRSQSRRVARHQHAGQQSDQQQWQLHLIAGQRLRTALHHDKRRGLSRRQLHDLGSGARPDHRHGRLQVAVLCGHYAGDACKRSVGNGEHQQPGDIPISGRGPAERGTELRLIEHVSAGCQRRRHHPLHRRLGGASRGKPGLVSTPTTTAPRGPSQRNTRIMA